MSSGKRRQPSMDLRGAMVTGSAFGDHATVRDNVFRDNVFAVGDAQPPSLDDLRAALAAARPELLDSAGTDEARADVERRLRQVEEELDEDEPQGAVVRSRWDQITRLVGTLTESADAAYKITDKITDLIAKIFGG